MLSILAAYGVMTCAAFSFLKSATAAVMMLLRLVLLHNFQCDFQ